MTSLLNAIAVAHDSVDGCLRWRCDQDINHGNFKQALKQLRQASNRSSIVAMLKSNSRPTWKKGAQVETEDASGQWRWAKILACHDDGTFNVYLYDDHAGGGQEWDNVRPVRLRSRSLCIRPQGIAKRPPSDIPRWDGDNGAAFMAAMAAHANDTVMMTKSVSKPKSTSKDKSCNKVRSKAKKHKMTKTKIKNSNEESWGYWEENDDSDSFHADSDSDFESELCELSKIEHNGSETKMSNHGTRVRSTPDETNMHSTVDQRRSKAKARLAKQKRKSKESHAKPVPPNNGKSRKKKRCVQNIKHKRPKIKLQRRQHIQQHQVQQLQNYRQQLQVQQQHVQHVQQHEHQGQQMHNRQQQQVLQRLVQQQQQVQQQLDVGQLSSNETNAQEQNVQLVFADLALEREKTTTNYKDKTISNTRNKSSGSHYHDNKLVLKIPLASLTDGSNTRVDDGKETKGQTASRLSSKKTLSRSAAQKRARLHKPLSKVNSAPTLYSKTTYVSISSHDVCKRSSKQF